MAMTVEGARKINYDKGFREKPRNQSVSIGKDVVFRCTAENPDKEFDGNSQWVFDKTLLGSDGNALMSAFPGHFKYIQDIGELHLHITNVTLEDDGDFECQMTTKDGPLRAITNLNVLVSPEPAYFEHYETGSRIEVNEGSSLNITCVGRNAKPEVAINWFVNGKLVTDNVQRWKELNSNKTISSFAALLWKPSKKDHNKQLTCEVRHPETQIDHRISLAMHVFYSSERPVIEVSNEGERIKVGNNVTLICLAEGGNPPPRLTWYLGDRPMKTHFEYDFSTQTTRNAFSFVAEGSDNGAVYECSSSNRENTLALKTSHTIQVDYPPATVSFVNVSTAVRQGRSITLTCRSSPSFPSSSISWFLNGAPTRVQPQSEIRHSHGSSTESSITIDTASVLSDVQQIAVDCTADNGEGSATKQHIVRILSPPMNPVIRVLGQGATLEGETLNLLCESLGGNPLATLTWYRNVLKLDKVRNTVDGNYTRSTVPIILERSMNNLPAKCESSNPALDYPLNATVILTVLFPPKSVEVRQMIKETDHADILAGNIMRLRCIVLFSNPMAEISWEIETGASGKIIQLPGTNVFNQSHEFTGYSVENVVEFVSTVEMDGYNAHCFASHPLWKEPVSQSFKMDVKYVPQIKINNPLTLELNEGDSFTEVISVIANPPDITYHWRKNGIGFNKTESITTEGPSIRGRLVTKDDAASYLLYASNKYGSAELSIKLIVNYAARVVSASGPIYADVGEDAVLECEADGFPVRKGMVQWTKEGMTLDTINDVKRSVLRLKASRENSGAYVCVADNGIGKPNYTTSFVLLKSAPEILRNQCHSRAAGPLKGRARIRCVARAVPAASFMWSFADGSKIPHNTSKYQVTESQLDHSTFETDLFINYLTEADYERKIRCRVLNAKGSDHINFSVGPLTAPDPPSSISVLSVTNTTAVLSWLPGFDGGSEQMFEVRYEDENGKVPYFVNVTSTDVTLKGLQPGRKYFAKVRAINSHGRSSIMSTSEALRTKNEDGTEFIDSESSVLSNNFVLIFLALMAILLALNCIVFGYIYMQHRRKLQAEKTEIVRRSNFGTDRRHLQLYGAIGDGLSPVSLARRPESNNANKSDLLNEPISEDDQSIRTMIQVSPNGAIQRPQPQFNRFYDGNHIVDEESDPACYSFINKGHIQSDYAHDPSSYHNVPHGSPSLTYADIGGSLRRGIDSPRRFGSVNGSLTDANRNFNSGTLSSQYRNQQPSFTTFGAPRIVGNPDGDLV